MTKRVRIVQVTVQVAAVLDDSDSDTLTPLQPQTVTYAAGDWPLFDLGHVRETIQRQVDAELAGSAGEPTVVPAATR